MLEYIEQLTSRYRDKGILLDTNLLLLLVVGHWRQDQRLILTDDLPLFHFLSQTGIDALNYNYLQTANW